MNKYLFSAILAMCSGQALSQSSSSEFDQLDVDRDGSLTQSEATASSSSFMFTEADKDRDGKVSRSEYDASVQSQGGTSRGTGSSGTDSPADQR